MDRAGAALAAIEAGRVAASVESRTLDFKRQGRSRDDTARDLAAAAACFANSIGGTVVVGVHDRTPGPGAFEGTDLDPDWLARRIYEVTDPPLIVCVETRTHCGVRLLEIRCPRSPEVHQVDGRATHRIGTSCERMSSAQIATVVAERRGHDWSAEDSHVPLTATSPIAVDLARNLLRGSTDPARRARAAQSTPDLLRALGLVTVEGTLVRAGELLFVEPLAQSGDLVVYQYRRSPSDEPALIERLGRPLLPALLRTLELVEARVEKTPVKLPTGQQLHLADLPEAAVREAIANAATHRDYRLGVPVQIEHAPTKLTVVSPGRLVSGVTVDNILTTSSRPRNARLTGAVRVLGLAEEAGVGVDRMYREMVRVGYQPPHFVENAEQVQVTLFGGAPNKPLARYIATLPPGEADDADTLLVLYLLLTRHTVNAGLAAPFLQKAVEEVEEILRRLSGDAVAMLEPTRETARRRQPNYRLREHAIRSLDTAVRYRRRTADETDRKVIELVRETGQVNARLIKIALDLNTLTASRVLGSLVERQILVKTSTSQRGPGVTYGPGPRFPATRPAGSRALPG